MTRKGCLFITGFLALLIVIVLLSCMIVTIKDGERYISISCGADKPIVYSKAGVYWKSCDTPRLLYGFSDLY